MVFGRKGLARAAPSVGSLEELKANAVPTRDADGVTRIFSKTLWDDPRIGRLLRQVGMSPDDRRNCPTTAEEHIARFARAREALEQRSAEFNREMAAKYGHCNARPMLVIAPEIWDGEHGAFLYGQLDLCGYDEWNVLMCAGDQPTIDRCGLIGHPGVIPALVQKMTEKIVELKALHGQALDAFGLRVLGQGGISREEYDEIVATIRLDLLNYVAFCRNKVVEVIERG